MSTVSDSLNRLLAIRSEKGFPIDALLQPGLTRAEIDACTESLPFTLPEEIYEMYQWRNGVCPDCLFFMFRDRIFLPLDIAVEEYHTNINLFESIENNAEFGVDLKTCFPFAGFEGAYYMLSLGSQSLLRDHERPVIDSFEGISPAFHSLEKMMETVTAWYEHGKHDPYSVAVDRETEIRIWKYFNPGIF